MLQVRHAYRRAKESRLPEEAAFLEPLEERLERGRSPGEEALEHWNGEWQGTLERFLEASRY